MSLYNLLTMANQIGSYFESFPDRGGAALEVANHLQRYWAPSMRARLLEHIDRAGDAELRPLVREALAAHRASLEPRRSINHIQGRPG